MKDGLEKLIVYILCCVVTFLFGMLVGKTISDETYAREIEESKDVRHLILEVYDNTDIDKIQVLTVYAGEKIICQYSGDMEKELSDDGTEIIFTFHAINDSCFDKGGNLLE